MRAAVTVVTPMPSPTKRMMFFARRVLGVRFSVARSCASALT